MTRQELFDAIEAMKHNPMSEADRLDQIAEHVRRTLEPNDPRRRFIMRVLDRAVLMREDYKPAPGDL
jgi:hypothetical protein